MGKEGGEVELLRARKVVSEPCAFEMPVKNA